MSRGIKAGCLMVFLHCWSDFISPRHILHIHVFTIAAWHYNGNAMFVHQGILGSYNGVVQQCYNVPMLSQWYNERIHHEGSTIEAG